MISSWRLIFLLSTDDHDLEDHLRRTMLGSAVKWPWMSNENRKKAWRLKSNWDAFAIVLIWIGLGKGTPSAWPRFEDAAATWTWTWTCTTLGRITSFWRVSAQKEWKIYTGFFKPWGEVMHTGCYVGHVGIYLPKWSVEAAFIEHSNRTYACVWRLDNLYMHISMWYSISRWMTVQFSNFLFHRRTSNGEQN